MNRTQTTTPYTLRASRQPLYTQKTKTQTRHLLTPRVPANLHIRTEADLRKNMANNQESSYVVQKRFSTESATRTFRAPDKDIEHFVWARDSITPKQEETMKQNVDIFLNEFKEDAKSNDYPECLPRLLRESEIPLSLQKADTTRVSLRSPRKVLEAFNEANYWKVHQKPLSAVLPDLWITKQFQNYVYDNQWEVPDVLKQAPVPPPPEPREKPKRTPLYLRQ